MKHSKRWLVLCLAAGCTYNEYHIQNEIIAAGDAGAIPIVGAGGASSGPGGPSSSAAGSSAQAGSGLVAAGAGGSVATEPDCSGCVRLRVSGTAEYQLEFDSRRNLSTSLVLWRVRVSGNIGVGLQGYVESGEHNDPAGAGGPGSNTDEATAVRTFVRLDPGSGWQDVGIDLQPVEPFRAASFVNGGGAAGAGFDAGFQFDKSRVQRVGLAISSANPSGVFTPATLEIDGVSFSNQPSLSVDFATDVGDFELVDPETAVVTHVPG